MPPSASGGTSQLADLPTSNDSVLRPTSGAAKTPYQHRLAVEALRKMAALVQNKCDSVYDLLNDHRSSAHENLLRYFEQERRVLVFETENSSTPDGMKIVCICTKESQLDLLRRDYSLDRLLDDLEDRLIDKELQRSVGVLGVKLDVEINRDELEMAETELRSDPTTK